MKIISVQPLRTIYLDKKTLLDEYLKSKSQGYLTNDFKNALHFLIQNILKKLLINDTDKKIYQWYIMKHIINNNWWINYQPYVNPNPIPYFSEIIKRACVISYNKIDKVRSQYYYEEIIGQRSKKLKKLNEKINSK